MSASELPLSDLGAELRPINWGRQIYFSVVAAIGLLTLYPAYNHWRIERYEALRQQISSLGGSAPRLRRTKSAEDVYWTALGGNMANVELRTVHFPQSATFSAEALRRLRSFREVDELHVDGHQLTAAMCREVFALRALKELRLCYCQLSDDELRGMERLHELETLDLQGTNVTDMSLARLACLRELEELNLQYTNITSSGAAYLAAQLPRTKILHRCWPSEPYRRACQRLFRLGAIIEIHEDSAMGDTVRLTRQQWRGTSQDLSELAHLDLALLELLSLDLGPEMMRALADLPNLKSLSLDHCGLGKIDFRSLMHSPALRNLGLKHVVVERSMVEQIAGIRGLDSLALVSTRLTPDALAPLSRLSRLKKLAVVGTRLREQGFAALAESKSIRHVKLIRVPLSDANLEKLSEARHIESLSMNQMLIGDSSISHLSHLAGLRRIDFDNTSFTTTGLQRLRLALPGCQVNARNGYRPPFDMVQFFAAGN